LRAADTDAVVFLNNDIRATRHDWLANLRASLEPGVLVGNISYARHGDVDCHSLPYIDGWCLAGMTEDFRDLGGWDEGYEEPSYFGDNDLCFRARLEGMTLRQADIGLEHLANRTAGPGDDLLVRRATTANYQRFASRVREELEVAA
jgi:GT2 family glycosyltransferase